MSFNTVAEAWNNDIIRCLLWELCQTHPRTSWAKCRVLYVETRSKYSLGLPYVFFSLDMPSFSPRKNFSLAFFLFKFLEMSRFLKIIYYSFCIAKKAVPLQAWSGPECSRKLRFQISWQRHRLVVRFSALCTGRFYPPGNTPGTHFC